MKRIILILALVSTGALAQPPQQRFLGPAYTRLEIEKLCQEYLTLKASRGTIAGVEPSYIEGVCGPDGRLLPDPGPDYHGPSTREWLDGMIQGMKAR